MEESLGRENFRAKYFPQLHDDWLKLLVDLILCDFLDGFKVGLQGILYF
jgi:hypothetical protein